MTIANPLLPGPCAAGGEHNFQAGPTGVVCCTRCGSYAMTRHVLPPSTRTEISGDSITYTGPDLTSHNDGGEQS